MVPLLSVITITYNDPEGLLETIGSLRPLLSAQLPWEHVIVDSSPDANNKVLDSLDPVWPLRRVITPARGIYSAMNSGVAEARGQYIWFLNGKDRLKSLDTLQAYLESLQASPKLDIIAGSVDRVAGGQYQFTWHPGRNFFLSTLGSCGPCHQGMIYRRESFLKVGLFNTNYKLGGDYEHHLRCLLRGLNIKTSNSVLAEFDTEGAGSGNLPLQFSELSRIHSSLKSEMGLCWYLAHKLKFSGHVPYLKLLKTVKNSSLGSRFLRPLWFKLKRVSNLLQARSD